MDIGGKIKKSRTDAKITQEQAAQALGISRQTISNWENERSYHIAFGEESYTVVTAATTSTFRYELIDAMAESQDYIIFLMKKRYAQPLDKRTLTGGTVEEFKRFLEEKTGKDFRRVK